jgi:acyl-CoA thioester hydrolase
MKEYSIKTDIRWGDLDPNFHVLHSKYFDLGAYCRMSFLTKHGITAEAMIEKNIGPIIFREECLFKKEIKFGDEITISLKLDKLSADYRKWTMVHELWKNGDALTAVITADGAWMDTKLRKVIPLPEDFRKGFDAIPKTKKFNQ